MNDILSQIRGGLLVSCQARKGQPFDSPDLIRKMAEAAALGGAAGIRADAPTNIRSIKESVKLPMIGVYKRHRPGRAVFITPELEDALAVADAGAEIIGLECTFQDDRRATLPQIVRSLRDRVSALLMAEVSTFVEGEFAAGIGFDLVATTLVGYTPYSASGDRFDFDLLDRLVSNLRVPVIAEGHVRKPEEAAEAIRRGAFAVVAGKAITMPSEATRWFVEAIKGVRA